MSMVRMRPASVRACSGVSTTAMPPALPRPPTGTWALTATLPSSRAAASASSAVRARRPAGMVMPAFANCCLAWYSRSFTEDWPPVCRAGERRRPGGWSREAKRFPRLDGGSWTPRRVPSVGLRKLSQPSQRRPRRAPLAAAEEEAVEKSGGGGTGHQGAGDLAGEGDPRARALGLAAQRRAHRGPVVLAGGGHLVGRVEGDHRGAQLALATIPSAHRGQDGRALDRGGGLAAAGQHPPPRIGVGQQPQAGVEGALRRQLEPDALDGAAHAAPA